MTPFIIVPKGKRFGNLVVFKELSPKVFPSGQKHRRFGCICDCGNKCAVSLPNLRSGNSTTCGCSKKTHGLTDHRLYSVWYNMHNRCYYTSNLRYPDYGGRGIRVCKRWHITNPEGLNNFIADMFKSFEEGLTLDRKDNEKGYSPQNCKWSTVSEQNFNQRKQKNRSSIFKGVLYYKKNKKWGAVVRLSLRPKHSKFLGLFLTETSAAKARNRFIVHHGLEKLNTLAVIPTNSAVRKELLGL